MSKRKLGMLFALMAAFVLSVSVVIGSFFLVRAEGIDASRATFGVVDAGTGTPKDSTTRKVGLTVNNNYGSNSFVTVSPSLDKIVYEESDGGSRTPTAVDYDFDDMRGKLVFSFKEDEVENDAVVYSVGDKLTLKSGFTFKKWDGADLNATLQQDVTAIYTANGWQLTSGSVSSQVKTASISQATFNTDRLHFDNSVIIDFGLTGVDGNGVMLDKESGWYNSFGNVPQQYYNETVKYIKLTNGGAVNGFTRLAFNEGKIAIADTPAQEGALLVLEKGLPVYEVGNLDSAIPGVDFCLGIQHYHPVVVLQQTLVFEFDGTKWNTVKNFATEAEFTNTVEDISQLGVGAYLPLTWMVNDGAVEPMPKFSTSNPEVATVDEMGIVKGVSKGEVTITAEFISVTASIDLVVGEEPEKSGYQFEIAGAAVRGENETQKNYLVAYVGEELDKEFAASRLKATIQYKNGLMGDAIQVTKDMISADNFDASKEGETSITVTANGLSGKVPVYVYAIETVPYVSAKAIGSWSNAMDVTFVESVGGNQTVDVQNVNINNNKQYGIPTDMVYIRDPEADGGEIAHTLHTVGQVSNLQCLLFFTNDYDGSKPGDKLKVGSVLTFTEDYRFYRYIDQTYIAKYKFEGELSFVWDGSAWQSYTADTESFTLAEDKITLPQWAETVPSYTLQPEGSYYAPSMVSDEETIVAVEGGVLKALKPGTANITITVGEQVKILEVTVVAPDYGNIEVANNRVFHVALNGKLDISKVRVKIAMGNGYYSKEITLSDEIAAFNLDTSKPGKVTLPVEIEMDFNGDKIEGTIEINVEVSSMLEIYPDNLICADDNTFFGNNIVVYFQKTFPNSANVTLANLTAEEQKTITDFIFFERKGAKVEIENPGFMTYMLSFKPTIDDEEISSYEVGDTILLKKGLSFYQWYGSAEAQTNRPIGEGDFVKVGELQYDVTFTYNTNYKFFMEIAAADGAVKEEVVEVGLGQEHASNVETIPGYATNGEWFFSSADESIASVNVNGLIKGNKLGETTITAVLKKTDGTEIKTLTFKVKVIDVVDHIKITSDKPVRVDLNTELDIEKLIEEFGIKGVAVSTSGIDLKEVDLAQARITGYDVSQEGMQTLTFRLTVDGKSITGTLEIQVGSTGGGCSSGIVAGFMPACLVLFCAVAVVLFKRKSKEK